MSKEDEREKERLAKEAAKRLLETEAEEAEKWRKLKSAEYYGSHDPTRPPKKKKP